MKNPNPQRDSDPTPAIGVLFRMLSLVCVVGVIAFVTVSLSRLPPMAETSLTGEARVLEGCQLGPDGFLTGRLFGGIDLNIDWRDEELSCDGIPRPDDRGARLFFGSRDDRVTLIIGIDSRIDALTSEEHTANITIIDGQGGAIYGSTGRDRCWTTVQSATQLGDQAMRLSGVLYCAGAIPAVQGAGSVTLDEFRYAGLLRFEDG